MTRRQSARGPRTLCIRVIIECPNVAGPDSARADWCIAELTDHLKRAGLTEQGLRWYVDDAYMKTATAPQKETR